MKRFLFFLALLSAGGCYHLYNKGVLDDLPHILQTATKPAHERPIYDFYYGLQRGDIHFISQALNSTGTEQLDKLQSLSKQDQERVTQALQLLACQLSFEIVQSNAIGDKASATIQLRTVSPNEFLQSLAIGTLGGVFTEKPVQHILSTLEETGCLGKVSSTEQFIELRRENNEWKICSECMGKELLLDLLFQVVGLFL